MTIHDCHNRSESPDSPFYAVCSHDSATHRIRDYFARAKHGSRDLWLCQTHAEQYAHLRPYDAKQPERLIALEVQP